jgi:surface polysaccharide O-acyltransferase-like enzyme
MDDLVIPDLIRDPDRIPAFAGMTKSSNINVVMKQSRIIVFDFLRLLAIIGVIAIHVSYPPLYHLSENSYAWWVSNMVESFLRWVVPAYFMLSGALLLSKDEPISVMFTRRLPRILVPFLFWTQIYILLTLYQGSKQTYIELLYKSISGPAYYHLWFVYTLIGLYIVTPLIRQLIKQARIQLIEYFLVLWFLFSSLFPLINKLLDIKLGVSIPFVDGYIGYFILGYYLYTYPLPSRIRKYAYFLTYLSWLIVILGTYTLTVKKGNYDDYFHGYLTVPVVMNSIAVFVYFQNLKLKESGIIGKLSKQINIGRICYGIYLSHLAVMYYLGAGIQGMKLNGNTIHPMFGIVATTVVTFVICFVFFYMIEKLNTYIPIKFLSRLIY